MIANVGGTALGDIALVPAPWLKHPKGIRDVAEWYVTTAARQDYVHAIFEKQSEIAIEKLAKLRELAGDLVQAVFLCGTDFGTQDSQFLSAATFRELYLPYYRRMNDWIHAHTPAGRRSSTPAASVEPLITAFADAGFDILNPVQINAADMDPQRLKDRYGASVIFWGGGVGHAEGAAVRHAARGRGARAAPVRDLRRAAAASSSTPSTTCRRTCRWRTWRRWCAPCAASTARRRREVPMSEILQKLSECVEAGKANAKSSYPPQLKGQPGADELCREALDTGVSPTDVLQLALVAGDGAHRREVQPRRGASCPRCCSRRAR